jgi:SAM-dependent methyltransferase
MCVLCGSTRAEAVGHRDRHGQPLQTVLCLGCGLVFTDPRPSAPALEHYYRDEYRREYKGATVPRPMQVYGNAMAAQDRLARIRRYLRAGGSVLDIGSGSGEFLYLLRHAGYRVRGLEPDAGYSSFSQDRLGLDVESRPLGPPVPTGSPFAAITIFHVLEHLENPRGTLATLGSWLEPGGVLVVEVPNIESRTTAPHHRFHRAHLYHFNLETLTALGEMNGLNPVERITAPDGGTITIVFVRETPPPVRNLADNADRVRQALNGYTDVEHYLGGTLADRQLRKLGRNLRGRWICRGLRDPAEVLKRAVGA